MKFVSVMIDREPGFVIFGDNVQHRSLFRSLESHWCGKSVVKLDGAGFVQYDPLGFYPCGESTSLGVSVDMLSIAGRNCIETAKLSEMGWVTAEHAFNPNPGNTFLVSPAIYSRLSARRFKVAGKVLPDPTNDANKKTNEQFEPYLTYGEKYPTWERHAILRTVKWLYQVENVL
jgi:hypothetical protein